MPSSDASLDVDGTIQAIQSRPGWKVNMNIPLALRPLPSRPVADASTAASLGITELVSPNLLFLRLQRRTRPEHQGSRQPNSTACWSPPGETFSMADALGDVSLENGYRRGTDHLRRPHHQGRGRRRVPGQHHPVPHRLLRRLSPSSSVRRTPTGSTTTNRTPAAIDPNLAGLDATVYVPLVDFKFINDTPYWLLMEIYVNPQQPASPGNSIPPAMAAPWTGTPPARSTSSPRRKPFTRERQPRQGINQIDWPADGADITVVRTVRRLCTDDFRTHYQPWQAICEYGPGTPGTLAVPESAGEQAAG